MVQDALKTPQVHPKTTRRHHARRSKTLQAPKTSKDASKMARDTCKTRPKTATNPSGYQNRNVLSVDSSLVLEAFLEPKTKPKWDRIGIRWELTETKWGLNGTNVGPSADQMGPSGDPVRTKIGPSGDQWGPSRDKMGASGDQHQKY